MIREYFRYKSTITTILAGSKLHVDAAKEAMISARQEIERTILDEPLFSSSFEPLHMKSCSVPVKRMLKASESAGTGPMAAVAGTIAWSGVEAMKDAGAKFAVIDNGGDIAYISDRVLRVGLYSGNSSLSRKMAFILLPSEEVYGVCTSSATVGPSISFGKADSVTVFSSDVSLADAWATSACNVLKADDNNELTEKIKNTGVDGFFGVIGDVVVKWGIIPKIACADVDENLITSG
ncbi:ApbE superfamily uncharacterized protein (UPF0280 family) [Methanomicrobium sp. W14]|jgi:ApbE superfamily uncharacterized protein (UPF0280 family)|uniref:UPF0280 family protein n=1 Tax=Methanomicrobium sp. W14 TaxID=2817839 RepID=UPI001AE2B901|nr:UPF0280 family protein [Methanomicrobium sp. W14]MBP2132579.1 ApbE superfamily uncharacterized protein (UPF0280 family) [Methanomicrobium sp. W14]